MTTGGQATGDARELEHEIEQTREQLGDTVEQLAAKADIKRLARAKAAELAGRMKIAAARVRQQPYGLLAAAAGTLAVAGLVIWRRAKR